MKVIVGLTVGLGITTTAALPVTIFFHFVNLQN